MSKNPSRFRSRNAGRIRKPKTSRRSKNNRKKLQEIPLERAGSTRETRKLLRTRNILLLSKESILAFLALISKTTLSFHLFAPCNWSRIIKGGGRRMQLGNANTHSEDPGINIASEQQELAASQAINKRYLFAIHDYHSCITHAWPSSTPCPSTLNPDHTLCDNTDDLAYSLVNNVIATTHYGLFSKSGKPIPEAFLWRGNKKNGYRLPCGDMNTINPFAWRKRKRLKFAIWIRYCHFLHFGHLLTETCSALYPLIVWKELGFDIEPINLVLHYQFRKSINNVKQLLNISGNNIYIAGASTDEALDIETIYIPVPTLALKDYSSIHHPNIVKKFLDLWIPKQDNLRARNTYSTPGLIEHKNYPDATEFPGTISTDSDHRLWISRPQLTGNSRYLKNEVDIEDGLATMGWDIIHPQHCELSVQLEALERSRVIAGIEGSAFHLLYGTCNTNKRIILLTWRDEEGPFDVQFQSQRIEYFTIRCLRLVNGASLLRNEYSIESIRSKVAQLARNGKVPD